MSIEVFWASGSGFSWRVLLALEVKGLPYQSRLLSFSQGDNRSPAFLAVNPRGRVPALRDGDFVVYESIAILAYLDRKCPDPPLFGRTPEERGRVWQAVMESVCYLDGPVDDFILPLYFGQAEAKESQVRQALPLVQAELMRLEAALERGPWLATDSLSAADIAVYPMIRSLQRAAEKPAASAFEHGFSPLASRYPRLADWMGRIEALPGYDRTFPPHWRT